MLLDVIFQLLLIKKKLLFFEAGHKLQNKNKKTCLYQGATLFSL